MEKNRKKREAVKAELAALGGGGGGGDAKKKAKAKKDTE